MDETAAPAPASRTEITPFVGLAVLVGVVRSSRRSSGRSSWVARLDVAMLLLIVADMTAKPFA